MQKRWTAALVVAIAGAIGVAGCGSSSSSSGGDSGGGGGPIQVGVLAPFSGIYAVAGNPVQDGARYWLMEHGNKVAGRDVKLTVADDKSTTQGEVAAANSLIRQQHVSAVVGLVNSAGALAARPTLMRGRVITLSVVANATDLLDTKAGPYLFMLNPAANETAAPSAVLAQKQGWNNVVGVADNYVGARTWLDPSLDAMQRLGIDVSNRIYPPFPTSDYGPYVSKIDRNGRPGLVYPVMFGPSALGFLKAYSSFGGQAPIYTTGSMFEPTSVSGDLLRSAQGDYAYWNYSPAIDTAANRAFVDGFRRAFHRTPGGFEMQSYAAMAFLDRAYEKAGKDASADDVRTAMQQVQVDSPVGPLRFGTEQAANWDIYLTRVGTDADGSPALIPVGPYVRGAHPDMTTDEAKAALAELPSGGQ